MSTTNTTAALIVAGGRGSRAKLTGAKQYHLLGGVPVLRRTVSAFAAHPKIDTIQVVIGDGDEAAYRKAVAGIEKVRAPVMGGESRQASVMQGLNALANDEVPPARVLIHDAARPFVSRAIISEVIEALHTCPGAIAALPVADTLKRASPHGAIEETVPRDGLWRAQTPQGFHFDAIMAAHRAASDGSATDDASLLEAAGQHVTLVPDSARNIKLTYPEDFALAEEFLAAAREVRTGLGIDVHAFAEGDAVILGGVSIPHTHRLSGHSDADVLLHALSDAIYGALGDGDIGAHFPPSEEKWRGAASSIFFEHAIGLIKARDGKLLHLDATLMCEAPKVGPHRDAIRASIAEMAGTTMDRVAIKATTTEKLGFTGRQEGIMCQAVATIEVPAGTAK